MSYNNKKNKKLSFADLAKKIDKKYSKASKYDKVAQESKESELETLRLQQEGIKNNLPQYGGGGALQGGVTGLSTGAQIGTMIMPGWGTAIGGGLGLIGGALMGSKAEDKAKKEEEKRYQDQLEMQRIALQMQSKAMQPMQYANMGMSNKPVVSFAYGGDLAKTMQTGLMQYNGPLHGNNPNGGIPIDKNGVPTNISNNQPIASTEGGELAYKGYIYSNKLGPEGEIINKKTISKTTTPIESIQKVPYKTIEQLPYEIKERIQGRQQTNINKTESTKTYSVSPNFRPITSETFRQHNKKNSIFSDDELKNIYSKDPKEAAELANKRIKETYGTLEDNYLPYKFEAKDGKLNIRNNRAIVTFNKSEYSESGKKKPKSIGDTYELYDYDKPVKDQLGDIQKRFILTGEQPKMQYGGELGDISGLGSLLGDTSTGLGNLGTGQIMDTSSELGSVSNLSSILGGESGGGFMQGLGNVGSFLNKNQGLLSGLSGLASEIGVNKRDIRNAIPAPVNYQRVTPYMVNYNQERQDIGQTFDIAENQARKNAINSSRTRGELMTSMAAANAGLARQRGSAIGQSYQNEQVQNVNSLTQANRVNSMIQMEEANTRQQELDAAEAKKSQAYHNISQSYQGFLRDQSAERSQDEAMKYLGLGSPSLGQIEVSGSKYPSVNVGNGLSYANVNGEKMYFYNNNPITQEQYKSILMGGS